MVQTSVSGEELDGEALLLRASLDLLEANKLILQSNLRNLEEQIDDMSGTELVEVIESFHGIVENLREFDIEGVTEPDIEELFEDFHGDNPQVKVDVLKAALAKAMAEVEQIEQKFQKELQELQGGDRPVVPSATEGMSDRVDRYDSAAAAIQAAASEGAVPPPAAAAVDPYSTTYIASREAVAAGSGGYDMVEPAPQVLPGIARRTIVTEASANLALDGAAIARLDAIKARIDALIPPAPEASVGAGVAAVDMAVEGVAAGASVVVEEPILSWREELEAALPDCEALRRTTAETRPIAERKGELEFLRSRFGRILAGLQTERVGYLQKLSANYELLRTNPDLRDAAAIVRDMEADLKYLKSMPSLSLLEQNLSTVDGLMQEAGTLSSDNVYTACFGSMVSCFAAAAKPFNEFVGRFDEYGQDVTVEVLDLTSEELAQRDAATHAEVEAQRQNVQHAVYSKRLRDGLSSLPGYRKGEGDDVYAMQIDQAGVALGEDLKELEAIHVRNQASIGEFGFSSDYIDSKYQGTLDRIERLRVQGPDEFKESVAALNRELRDKEAALAATRSRLASAKRALQKATSEAIVIAKEDTQKEQEIRALEEQMQHKVAALEEGWQKSDKEAEVGIADLRAVIVRDGTALAGKKKTQGSFFGRLVYGVSKGFNFKALGNEIATLEGAVAASNEQLRTAEAAKVALNVKKEEAIKALQVKLDLDKQAIMEAGSVPGRTTTAKAEEISRLNRQCEEMEADLESMAWDLQYLGHSKRIVEGNLRLMKEAEDILAKKAAMPEIAAAGVYVVSEAEAAMYTLMGDVAAYNDEVAAREDVSGIEKRHESLEGKKQSFHAVLHGLIVEAAGRAHAIASGDEEMKKNLKRRALALGAAVGKTVGGPVGGAIALGATALDSLFATWQKTANDNVMRAFDTMGDDLEVVVNEIVARVTDLFADDNSPDAAFNRIQQEATIAGLASEIAVVLIQAIGDEKVDMAHRRPSPSSFEVGADGIKRVKAGTPFSGFIDDLVSRSLEREGFERFKAVKKVVSGRATTEEGVRGNLTAAGARNGVGLQLVGENGETVRLVPAGREDAKYGFRKATTAEQEAYSRTKSLKGYAPYVSLELRFDQEFDNLVRITRLGNSMDGRTETQVADALGRMVMFFADQRQFISAGRSATAALRSFASTLTPPEHRMVLSDEAVASIEKLANLYNESTNTKTRKGVFFAGYKVDLTNGVALGLRHSLRSSKFSEATGYEEDFFEGQESGIDSAFRGRVLDPQESLIAQAKVFIERQLKNPDCDLFVDRSGDSGAILEDLMTIIQRNANAMSRNDSIAEEMLLATGLFNLDSPINKAKFKALKLMAVDLAKLHVEFERDHTPEEAAAYYHFDSSERQYDSRMTALCDAIMVLGSAASGVGTAASVPTGVVTAVAAPALPPEQREELARIVRVYYETKEGGKMRHGDRALTAVYDREMAQFYERFAITPPTPTDAAAVQDSFRKVVDAHSLVQGRNTEMPSLTNRFTTAIRGGAATLKSGARVERAAVAIGGAIRDRLVGKSVEALGAELQPTTTQAEAVTALNEFVKDHLLRSPANSLYSNPALAYGSTDEIAQDMARKMIEMAQKYAQSAAARAETASAVPADATRILASAASFDAVKAFMAGNEEFKSMIDLSRGGKVLESERRKIVGIFSNLVKLHLKTEREPGYVIPTPALAGAEFDTHMTGLAASLGINDDVAKGKLVDAVQDYVLAMQRGGDPRKYKHMLMDRVIKLNPALALDPADLDYSNGVICHPVIGSCIRACKVAEQVSRVDYADVAKLEAKLESALPLDLVVKPPHSRGDIAEAICAKAASPEFVAATPKGKKAMLAEMVEKGDITRSYKFGRVSGWSEERLKFDAVFDCMLHLSKGYEFQQGAGVAVVPGAHLSAVTVAPPARGATPAVVAPSRDPVASDTISVGRASVSSVSIGSAAPAVDDIGRMQEEMRAKIGAVKFSGIRREADLSRVISEAIVAACEAVDGKVGEERDKALEMVREGYKEKFKVAGVDIGTASRLHRTAARATYDQIMNQIGQIAIACVEKGRRFESIDRPIPPATNVSNPSGRGVSAGREVGITA